MKSTAIKFVKQKRKEILKIDMSRTAIAESLWDILSHISQKLQGKLLEYWSVVIFQKHAATILFINLVMWTLGCLLHLLPDLYGKSQTCLLTFPMAKLLFYQEKLSEMRHEYDIINGLLLLG